MGVRGQAPPKNKEERESYESAWLGVNQIKKGRINDLKWVTRASVPNASVSVKFTTDDIMNKSDIRRFVLMTIGFRIQRSASGNDGRKFRFNKNIAFGGTSVSEPGLI